MNEDALKAMGRKYGYGGKEAYVDCPACGERIRIDEFSDHVCPGPHGERKPGETPTLEKMPSWWDERMAPVALEAGKAYKDKYGQWRDHTGRLIPRRERRANKLR